MDKPKQADACTFVVFGASGDLTKRLLVPALSHLEREGLLADGFKLVGVSRGPIADDAFRARFEAMLRDNGEDFDDTIWKRFANRLRYVQGDLDAPETYARLKSQLGDGNQLFYLAIPASEFTVVARQLGQAGLARETNGAWRRIVVEKPFGHDLKSARELNHALLEIFDEDQIFRIDHYLGKETVQNIMVLRFGNGLFEPIWNRDHIDHVEITVAETLGVEARGKYFDATGTLRDMVPNHLFQLLTLTAMEPPSCFEANATRNEKAKVLDAVRGFTPETARRDAVRAQYAGGEVLGKSVVDYRDEPDVARESTTETYVAMKLGIENWRWVGVPFYLRTGKVLAARKSEIVIQFKRAPLTLFHGTPASRLTPNDLRLRIQPEEGVSLRFGAKVPGPSMRIGDVEMTFKYGDYFRAPPSNGYETLLYDCMTGDRSLFQRADTIEAAWSIIQPVLDAWETDRTNRLPLYAAGSEGPAEADALIARDGRAWRSINGENGKP